MAADTSAKPVPPPEVLHAYNGGGLIAANTIILCVSTILLAFRLYARSLTSASRGWDEFLLPIAWLLLLGLIIICYLEIPLGGVGHHLEAVLATDPSKLVNYSKLLYILDWFYVPSNLLSRLSVVLLYLRIFVRREARFFCWIVFAFLIGNCVATIIAAQLECTPLEFTWDKAIPGGRCFNLELWYKLTNIPNVVADVAILLLPIETVWTLKASLPQRIGILCVFLAGSIGLIASSVRTAQFFSTENSDATWAGSSLLAWTVVECGMYFSAACLVGLRPVVSRFIFLYKKHVTHSLSGSQSDTFNGTIGGGYDNRNTLREQAYAKKARNGFSQLSESGHLAPSSRLDRELELESYESSSSLEEERHLQNNKIDAIHVQTTISVGTDVNRHDGR